MRVRLSSSLCIIVTWQQRHFDQLYILRNGMSIVGMHVTISRTWLYCDVITSLLCTNSWFLNRMLYAHHHRNISKALNLMQDTCLTHLQYWHIEIPCMYRRRPQRCNLSKFAHWYQQTRVALHYSRKYAFVLCTLYLLKLLCIRNCWSLISPSSDIQIMWSPDRSHWIHIRFDFWRW